MTFLDCDDCLADHFLDHALPLCEQNADLIIFGIEGVYLSGRSEYWTVQDRVYPNISDFADEYIRTRAMLIYSACNKFYRRSILEEAHLLFDENIHFGEDRLFNYRYLKLLDRRHQTIAVITKEEIMCRYLQHNTSSMSSRTIPHYFDLALKLHRAKTETFLALSRGTDKAQRQAFCSRDLGNEIMQTVDRFTLYPQEKEENLPAVNALIFNRFPSLKKLIPECGVSDPDEWYHSETSRKLVIEYLRTFYEMEK